jgi:hypothetical protein
MPALSRPRLYPKGAQHQCQLYSKLIPNWVTTDARLLLQDCPKLSPSENCPWQRGLVIAGLVSVVTSPTERGILIG